VHQFFKGGRQFFQGLQLRSKLCGHTVYMAGCCFSANAKTNRRESIISSNWRVRPGIWSGNRANLVAKLHPQNRTAKAANCGHAKPRGWSPCAAAGSCKGWSYPGRQRYVSSSFRNFPRVFRPVPADTVNSCEMGGSCSPHSSTPHETPDSAGGDSAQGWPSRVGKHVPADRSQPGGAD